MTGGCVEASSRRELGERGGKAIKDCRPGNVKHESGRDGQAIDRR
jgi:hypothetical protein